MRVLLTSSRIPNQICPYCGIEISGAAIFGIHKPEPGNVCVCIECQGITIFNEKMQLVKPATKEVLAELEADPEVQKIVLMMKFDKARRKPTVS